MRRVIPATARSRHACSHGTHGNQTASLHAQNAAKTVITAQTANAVRQWDVR